MRYLLIFTLILFACHSNKEDVQSETKSQLEYAKFFSLQKSADTVYISVNSSHVKWEKILDLKVHQGKVQRQNGEWKSLDKCLLISASQLGAFKLLKQLNKVQGFNNIAYAYDSLVRAGMDKGSILTIGEMSSFNNERILQMKPDAIFYSAEIKGSAEFKFYESQGIIMIPVLEWREGNALARAEWIKFYGGILGQSDLANSIFNEVREKYSENLNSNGPSVMIGNDYKGVWYTPAGESYVAKMMSEAGAKYIFSDTKGNGSLAKDFEVMILKCGGADYWINPGTALNLAQLKSENQLYARFKAFKRKKVFNSTKRRRADGANDYWETGVFLPHIVQQDYLKIFRGEIDSLYFYQRLN